MIELQKQDLKLLKEIEEVTLTNYEIKDNHIDKNNLLNALEELFSEYKHLEDEFKEFDREVQENYKKVAREEEMYG